MPEEIRQVDIPRGHSGDILSQVVFLLKLVQAQREGIHEDHLQKGKSQGDDWSQLLAGDGEESLDVFYAELQEVGDVAIPEDVDALTVLVVDLAPLHYHVLE
jgi:hypothetical protein